MFIYQLLIINKIKFKKKKVNQEFDKLRTLVLM